ncbi:alpha-2-macroglobulin family protein [Deinococcus fonticola]|uniref:alpha-2-macroglobulin family protein n=1 Tax=Deinococcus fonticola TaxID=2528713 RepID=UPI0010753EBB|nr:MG2 domain-containing protein [Deinococcus fonticola]
MGKARWGGGVLLAGLLLGLGGAQSGVSVYGGQFMTGRSVNVEVSAPKGTLFRVERVLDPAAFLSGGPNPSKPVISPGLKTQVVGSYRAVNSRLNLGRLPSGVYLVRSGPSGGVVLVSRLGLIVKRDQSSALVYAADRESGQPRQAQVWALRAGGLEQATKGVTVDGRWKTGRNLTEAQVFLARSGNDWAVSGSNWNSYAAPKWLGHVYTDRPIYRPGHRVEFKGVLRKPGSLAPVANTPAVLRVTDADGQEVLRQKVTTNAYGAVSAGLDLRLSARLGDYRVALTAPGEQDEGYGGVSGTFSVEEYQKPEYAVTVEPQRRNAVQGEKVSVKVSARYLFGGVPGGAKVTYNVTRARYYPPGFDLDSLPPGEDEGADYGSDLVIQDTARLDANGEFMLTLPLAKDREGQPVRYRIEAEVEDESRKPVSSQTQVIAYPAAVNVETQTGSYIYDAGKPITVSLDTRNLEGQGQAARVTLELVRQDWVKRAGKWVEQETVMDRRPVTTSAAGRGTAKLVTPRGGGYVVRARVQDAQGRTSTSDNFLWVLAGNEDWNWVARDIGISLDRRQYAPGDTATVLVTNPHPGKPVLLTLEGDRLRSSTVLRGQGGVLTYRFKVTPDMSPNIFVGAAAFSDGDRFGAEARVRVPRPDSALTVKVTPDRPRYKPGEAGTFKVQVRNARGQGVPAEVALGVVDEAIYLVKRDNAPTLLQVFTAERENQVGTSASADFYFEPLGSATARAPLAPMSAAAFAQSKAEAEPAQSDETPREIFKDTLIWVPKLVTDARGQAQVDVKFPDNLTTWIATARAHTREARFGQATGSALVTKDVIARLSLPAFLVRGDRVTLGGIVNNTLKQSVTGTAKATLQGLSPLNGAVFTPSGAALTLAANGRVRQDLTVGAPQVGLANVMFSARTNGGSDALKLPLPVKARGYEETKTLVGSARQPSVTFTLPAGTNPATVKLNVSATPSLLSAVTPALEYLLGYPYGCTEQTMSRFLPALLARQALGAGTLPPDQAGKLNEYTELGLARLAKFQHEDGGWNFWEFDESTLEMTAYVTEGLLRAKAVGARVDNAMLDRALKYLSRHAKNGQERPADRARAYRALSQAGRVNTPELLAFSRRADLVPYSLANTAMALKFAGQLPAAKTTLQRLKARRIAGNGLVHWEGSARDLWFDYWDDNSNQVTAAALEALALLEPQSTLIPAASQWLLTQRRGPQWLSTQDTASVVVAALSLPRAQASAPRALPVQVDGRNLGPLQVQGRSASLELAVPLGAGQHTLTLSGAPAGTIYSAEVKYAREPAQLGGLDRGIAVTRRYEKLTPRWDAKNERYTYARTPLMQGGTLKDVKVGDLVLVTLTVDPKNDFSRYLLVSDPIPAGTKAMDERSLVIAGLEEPDEYAWRDWDDWYSGRDLRDDRVDLYAASLHGTGKMTYLLRVQTPGTFTALPTHAFLMYSPDVQGYSPAATFTVKP